MSGTVTFNGQPVEKGYVNFFPEDGKSPPAGGDISGGKFSAANVTLGKNKVVVSSQSSGGQAATSMGSATDPKKLSSDVDPNAIKPNDNGNSQSHEIASGQPLTLALTKATSSGGPVKK